jgi:hypothetical protein
MSAGCCGERSSCRLDCRRREFCPPKFRAGVKRWMLRISSRLLREMVAAPNLARLDQFGCRVYANAKWLLCAVVGFPHV